ncbi:hypothetical protein LJC19_04660 [Oxalobacter sp. OttesenSCG-928-P03]|nr:hypothetical protein [Oxalobacter sp. OttesenSCG-928-P03]
MNITYTIQQFEPLQGIFVVAFKAEGAASEIALNIPLPLKDGAFLKGEELDDFIRQYAPVSSFEVGQLTSALDASEIQSLIPQGGEGIVERVQAELDAGLTQWVDSQIAKRPDGTPGYASVDSAIKYIDNTVFKQWAVEAVAIRDWNTRVWVTALSLLNEVLPQIAAGKAPPTLEEVIAKMPVFVWPEL